MAIEKIFFTDSVTEILVRDIEVINSRERDKEKFEEVVDSIRRVGLLKPILVNSNYLEQTGKYELLCGEGRLLACKRLGLEKILAEVISCSRKVGYVISLVENTARKRYTTIELARLIYNLHQKGATHEELSKITNRSTRFIAHYLKLIKNGEERLIKAVEENRLPISVAARIASSPNEKVQDILMEAINQKVMSGNDVYKVRKLIEARMGGKKRLGYRDKKERDLEPEIPLSVNELKKDFRNTIRKQEEYIQKCKRLENTVSLLQGFIETILRDETFRHLITNEGITVP
jgi:ParB family chromosome partitioning protein